MQAKRHTANFLLLLWTISATLTALIPQVSATVVEKNWRLQRDDIAEYSMIASVIADRKMNCLANTAANDAHAASFDAASGTCSLFVCKRGTSGCRKCRNSNNLSMHQLWMRPQPVSCWKTFQHRVDASVSFKRSWTEYVNGFGQGENLNYWMGLEQLHQITKDGVWRVRWEFSAWNGSWYWAENVNFSVADASDKYRAKMGSLDSSKSNVGQRTEADLSPNNQQFSTVDSDNDAYSGGSCALERSAGWWFGSCTMINANGIYVVPPAALDSSDGSCMFYYLYNSRSILLISYSMKTFECLIQQ